MLWPCAPAWGVPAAPVGVDVAQPDGTRIRLYARGDEYFAWHETAEGYAVARDTTDGFWKFAVPAPDRAEFRVIPDARVGVADPASRGVSRRAMPAARLLRDHLRQQREAVLGVPVEVPVPSPEEPLPEPLPQGIPVSGIKTVKNIVILAAFSNHWNFSAGTVSSSCGRVDMGEYSNLFNQVGYTADSAVGSVRDYYAETSYGRLTLQSVVTVWVRLPETESYYGTGRPDAYPAQMVSNAIDAADAAGFNFAQGDSDGDGWVDSLTIIHSGYGQEYGNPLPDLRIWSHQGSMASVVTKDGVKMYRYHTEPALRNASGTGIIRIGVICHEMGHFFGLPDLYDYSGTTDGLGDWSLMAGGSWNGTDGKRPAHFDAWCKSFLGFVNPVPLHSQPSVSVPRAEDNRVVKMLRDGLSNGEYFLFENRANTGFDNDTAAIFPGLLIYHVDSKSANNDLGTWSHPLVKIEEADGDDSCGTAGGTASEAGDVWTSTSGLSGGFRDQTGVQSANAMLYQTAFYNRPDSATYYSYNRVTNFSAAGSTMSCDVMTLRTTVSNQTVSSTNYTVMWPACTQATQYEVQEGARATLTSFTDGAEDEDAMYENWYLGGTAKRDSGGARTGSYSYAMHQYYSSRWGSSVQSLTMRKPFRVTTSTVISFYLMSHLASGYGYLKCQISNDSGDTWQTLGTYDGYIDPWSLRSYNYTAISAAGISAGDLCIVRFVVDFEYGYGWSPFPGYGYAVDDISITGIQMDGYGGWTSLATNVVTTSYSIPSRTNGVYAYRVRAYANSAWQGYGSEGETTVNVAVVTRNLDVVSAYGNASPSVGTNTYPSGTSLACAITNSPATLSDAQGAVTCICTGWTGTGSVPAVGGTTNTGSFNLNADSSITWLWVVTDRVLSNQTVSVTTNVQARDTVRAGTGYRVVSPGNVTLQAGKNVRLAPGFTARSGSVFRARATP
jgi:M6 family metalloprotease-like protein